jgi:HD-like signal output (HDOD) protein
MPAQLNQPDGAGGNNASSDESARLESARLENEQSQEARVRALLADGIPTLPAYVFELSTLLSSVPVDLRRVCRIIRTDPSLAAQVIRLCNTVMLGLRGRVSYIEHAVILLGTERLRTLVLTCSLVQHIGNFLSAADLQSFWQHSLLTATLSERSAFCLRYLETEQAYLAGLLHDLGVLPLLLLAPTAREAKLTPGAIPWGESVDLERQHCGVDHCLVGKCIGLSWNFAPEIIDVLEHHHRPQDAQHDRTLVEIVVAADLVCQMHGVRVGGEPSRIALADRNAYKSLLDSSTHSLTDDEKTQLAKILELEFPEIVHLLELPIAVIWG